MLGSGTLESIAARVLRDNINPEPVSGRQERLENLTIEVDRQSLVDRLIRASVFEQLLQTRYLGPYGHAVRTVLRPGGRFILWSFLDEAELEPLLAGFHSVERTGPWHTAWVAQTPVVE